MNFEFVIFLVVCCVCVRVCPHGLDIIAHSRLCILRMLCQNESIRDNNTHTHSRRTDTISLARHPFAMDVMAGLPSTGRTNLHKQTNKKPIQSGAHTNDKQKDSARNSERTHQNRAPT